MDKLSVVKWTAVALHGIVLIFAVFITFALVGDNVTESLVWGSSDFSARHPLVLVGLVIVANATGVILLLTPLLKSFTGGCIALAFEVSLLIFSLFFLSADFGVVSGAIASGVLFVVIVRFKERR